MKNQLDELVEELTIELKPLSDEGYIVFHDAYQYFEKRFGISAVGSVTVSPEKVYQNVYGATIGTVSANWNDFTHAYMGYNNHTFFELSEEFILRVFKAIHQESINNQNQILKKLAVLVFLQVH